MDGEKVISIKELDKAYDKIINLRPTCNQLATDCVSRQAAINIVDSETVSTNPEHFKSSEKFIKFMDNADIASFGKWQWANGFNTALVATKVQLKKLPSAEPERKKGKWTIEDCHAATYKYCCSICKAHHRVRYDFCPSCGADMRGEAE